MGQDRNMMVINKKNLLKYENLYDRHYKHEDQEVETRLKSLLVKKRYLEKDEFVDIARWKSKRPTKHYRSKENDDITVREITKFSFQTISEKARVESLMVLRGISWPVASTILHFAFPEQYPIMDFRVIWSLGWNQPISYNFNFWQKYCAKIDSLSQRYELQIRTIEKALWRYSKDHQ
jgi:hypothetical protein